MPAKKNEADTLIEVDSKSALERFISLARIPGKSGEEAMVAAAIIEHLKEAGVAASQIKFDDANTRTPIAGDCGNLFVSLPGNGSGPRTLLSAHMDTVPICVGSQPMIDGKEIRSSVETGLGADDRAGCAAILTAIVERLAKGDENYPPAVISFLIQEEVGLQGAKAIDKDAIGHVDRAFNFDGGTVEKLTIGAIGGERMSIQVNGIPAHAGVAPEKGVSAIVIAARAIADLDARGWLGKVVQDAGVGTANVGVIQGGDATNVITPQVNLRAEARSHDAEMRTRIVQEIRSAFERAASEVKSDDGRTGSIEFDSNVDYESFQLADDHPSIAAAFDAIRRIGREPFAEVSNGGLDANWLFLHGIEAVTMGCGQKNIHTADERLVMADYDDACRIATWLITDGASG
ncbi:Carboxypeptidase G2 precursor [Rubripirellula lacrimiformis]|uniref:Carboxypeptidase G2 n=1 Tax=Rubripirellula lacrimiformis TaxID=1930273 RepID=A0A517NI31_9BACT|nr:M20/M25/M40 family metallo-hydrolase [Rubripirellula lacrimiformis]QDT06795.1 Carboxypeptidase G2 precursor [Rubripirellula lacrimiformis]